MQRWGKARRDSAAAVALGILLASGACSVALSPSSEISQYAHTAWKERDGFTEGYIDAIAQTPDGYLWLGTEFGLLRFDGVRSVHWQPPPGQDLPSTYIRSLLAARDGRIWIGTTRGLASWEGGKLTQYPELAGQDVDALLEDHDGTLWAGGSGAPAGKLCAIQGRTVQCYGQDGSFGPGVLAICEDSRANLWASAYTGLWRMKPGPPKVYPQPYSVERHLVEGDGGALLIGTPNGIRQLAEGKTEPYPLPDVGWKVDVNRILRDRNGGLWIGTGGRGLVHLHQGKTDVYSQSDGLSGNTIYNIFEDREGSIWVATVGGLDRFRDYAIATISVPQGLSNPAVESVLAARDGSVWMGTGDGLNQWKDGKVTVYRRPHPSGTSGSGKAGKGSYSPAVSNTSSIQGAVQEIFDKGLPDFVPSLSQDADGRILVFTLQGVSYFEDGRFVPARGIQGDHVYSLAEGHEGDLWLSIWDKGLVHLRRGHVVDQVSLARLGLDDFASAILPDPVRGGLWIGLSKGGLVYLKDGQLRASYPAATGFAGPVMDIKLDENNTLWAATGSGLSRVKNGRVATLTSKNGLPCNTIHWMMEDDHHAFWLYTTCGLVRIAQTALEAWAAMADEDPNRTVPVTVFDTSDGVRSRAHSGGQAPRVTKSADGELWFLPRDGVSVINPRQLVFNQLPPPVHIEQITADGKTYWQSSSGDASSLHPKLPPLVRDLTIDYTALSLVAPEKVHFRFKLEGQDKDWREVVNDRRVEYSNLAPRKYRFRVMACNNSGVWNEAGDALDFSIAPAYWQTNWFRALCVAAFLALIWAAYLLRVRQIQEQEKKFREAVESMPALAFIVQPDGYRTFVNQGWIRYTGLTLEQASGSGWHAAVHPDDLNRVLTKWQASLPAGEPLEYENRLRRADKEYRWFLTRAVPVRDRRGKIVKWIGTATDIEDRKRAEQLQGDLAHVNRVSTLGELAASISHELKQPIAAAMTNANTGLRWLRRDQPDVEEASEAMERIVKDNTRAAEIIDRLRSLYKKSPPQRELLDVNEVVQEMVALLRGEANRNAVSIRSDLAVNPPTVMADRVQMQQVLMNIMLNGIEAMKETGGILTVKSQPGQDGQVLISVSDTGVGLPEEKADQIFSAFFTTKPQGSGMGLAISRSIVESHGGRLWATANDGRGATFHFTLPIAAEEVKIPAGNA